jgi:hypothetical protein
LTLEEVKTHLHLESDYDDDDVYLTTLIKVAHQIAEKYIGFDIAYTYNQLKVFGFCGDNLVIKTPNLSSISGISYLSNGEYIPVTDYKVLNKYGKSVISFQTSFTNIYTITTDELLINFFTGYETDLEIPLDIKQSLLIKVADLYDVQRSNYTTNNYKESRVFETILDFYKQITIW